MIVTEEEAKTKRCQESYGPLFMSPDGQSMMFMAGNFGSGYALQASPSYCIGSACMAWRLERDEIGEAYEHPSDGIRGYCGKAGKP